MNVRPPKTIDPDILALQDEYLQDELKQKGIVELSELKPVRKQIYSWKGDTTRLKVWAIVNAANDQMLGCFVPGHHCIDNAIHTYAGMQLRQDCAVLMDKQGYAEPTGQAKITKAYNLPCQYVIHTVGPIVYGQVTKLDCELLSSCYRACLELADQYHLSSLAFCCISTGVFHFPNELAAQIAVETVEQYLVYGLGLVITTIGTCLFTNAALGQSPYSSLSFMLNQVMPIGFAAMTFLQNCFFVSVETAVCKHFGLFQIKQIVLCLIQSALISLLGKLLAWVVPQTFFAQIILTMMACATMALGIFMILQSKLVVMPYEGALNAICDRFHMNFGKLHVASDLTLAALSVILSLVLYGDVESVGFGTLASAGLTGTMVNAYKFLFGRFYLIRKGWMKSSAGHFIQKLSAIHSARSLSTAFEPVSIHRKPKRKFKVSVLVDPGIF